MFKIIFFLKRNLNGRINAPELPSINNLLQYSVENSGYYYIVVEKTQNIDIDVAYELYFWLRNSNITSPSQNMTFNEGDEITIQWESLHGFEVDIYIEGCFLDRMIIVSETENDGSFSWTIPTSGWKIDDESNCTCLIYIVPVGDAEFGLNVEIIITHEREIDSGPSGDWGIDGYNISVMIFTSLISLGLAFLHLKSKIRKKQY